MDLQQKVAELCDAFWNDCLEEEDREWLRENVSGTLETWQAEYAERHRKPTREEIILKMNYRFSGTGDWVTQFNDALRQTLAAALTLPRETDYAEHFNYSKKFDLFWYFRADRLANPFSRPSALLIELRLPDDIEIDVPWGFRSGEIAAILWLMDEDRQDAEDFFPMLDS